MGRLIDLETLRCHGLRSTVGNLTQRTTEGLPAHLASAEPLAKPGKRWCAGQPAHARPGLRAGVTMTNTRLGVAECACPLEPFTV